MNNKMTINEYLSVIESINKINEQAEKKQIRRYWEYIDSFQMGGGRWMRENVEGIKMYKLGIKE